MAIPPSLKKRRKEVTPTAKKARLTMKVFATLQSKGSLDKIIEKATDLISGESLIMEDKLNGFIAGTNAIAKILPYILPKQSDGNALQVQINNNLIAGETTKDGKTVITLEKLMQIRGLSAPNSGETAEYTEISTDNDVVD